VDIQKIGYRDEPFIMVQQASQVFYVKDPTSEHWYVVLHGKKQGEAIYDIENGDPRSFTPMIINKMTMYLMMYMQPVKTTVKEFTYEHSTNYGSKFRNIFDNTHLEFYGGDNNHGVIQTQ